MSFSSAVTLSLRRGADVVAVRLHRASSLTYVRPKSSDIECLLQVLANKEYLLPFDVTPRVIVDAGANIGAASLFFADKYPDARIFALEPEESNFQLLKLNCAHLPNVTPIRAALWPKSGHVTVTDPSAAKWAFTVREETGLQGEISGVTVTELMQQYGLEQIDLLKLDIEGAEKEVFGSGPTPWLDHIGIIAIELHDRFKPGCAEAFYSALHGRSFEQELRGENVIVRLKSL